MPQVLRVTGTPQGYDIGVFQSYITALRASIVAGDSIDANDIYTMMTMYNAFIAHTHVHSDLRGVDTYGNVGVYGGGTYGADKTTTIPYVGTGGDVPFNAISYTGTATGNEITASSINALINGMNSIRSHYHNTDDATG